MVDDEQTVTLGQRGAHAKPLLASRYEIVALLGQGGMGSVFLAHDRELDERIALKMVQEKDPGLHARLRDEVKLARRVTHPNVARTYDIGEHEGEPFLTMEYIDGEPLSTRLGRDGPLSFAEIVRVGEGICAGLEAAHAAGVIHRDLKPGNVMLARDGRVVIMDFGLAMPSRSADAASVGTIAYMAPEQYLGGITDERTDIYAFGALLYRIATGHKPFESLPSERQRAPDPCERRASLPKSFGEVVKRCLANEPVARYASIDELREALCSVPRPDEEDSPATRRSFALVEALSRTIALVPANDDELSRALRTGMIEALARNPAIVIIEDDRDAESTVVFHTAVSDRLRVDLHATSHGIEFWSATIEDARDRIFDLAATIAQRIAQALNLDLPASNVTLPSALVLPYLEVRAHLRSRDPRRFEIANAICTTWSSEEPLLMATAAHVQLRRGMFTLDGFSAARDLAKRAARRDPDLAEARFVSGFSSWHDGDSRTALNEILHALELDPGHADARLTLGTILIEIGAPARGIRILEEAVARVPTVYSCWYDMARGYALLQRYDRALQALTHIPRDAFMGFLSLLMRMRLSAWREDQDDVARVWELVHARIEQHPLRSAFHVYAHAMIDRLAPRALHATHATRTVDASRRRRIFEAEVWAEIGMLGRDPAFALDQIANAVDGGLCDYFWIDRCPLFNELLGMRRFEELRDVVRQRARSALELLD